MNRLFALPLLIMFVGCNAPVTSTFVDGGVAGISIPVARGVSATDKDLLGSRRVTVWLGTGLRCSDLQRGDALRNGTLDLNFGPSVFGLPDGGRLPVLIVSSGRQAFFDTGDGGERLTGAVTDWRVDEPESGAPVAGRFTATFDAGVFSGEFIAPPCANASAGCNAVPTSLVVCGLALLRFLRRKQPVPALRTATCRETP